MRRTIRKLSIANSSDKRLLNFSSDLKDPYNLIATGKYKRNDPFIPAPFAYATCQYHVLIRGSSNTGYFILNAKTATTLNLRLAVEGS